MSTFPTTILLATDGSGNSELAATTALGLARVTGSELHVVHVGEVPVVLHPEARGYPALYEARQEEARNLLEKEVERLSAEGAEVARSHLRMGRADEEIVALAEELDAGTVVVGSRGLGGVRRALMGSVSDSVLRHAHCPVLVVRGKPAVFPAKMLLASDGSEESAFAAEIAADLAARTGSELHVTTVSAKYPFYEIPDSPAVFEEIVWAQRMQAQAVLDEQAEEVGKLGAEVTKTHLRSGRADGEIVVLAENLGAGLLVVGSRGLNPSRRALVGGVSDSVVRHAHCPVLVARRSG
jgi:nucleotide-binding universal stress UspA family protein